MADTSPDTRANPTDVEQITNQRPAAVEIQENAVEQNAAEQTSVEQNTAEQTVAEQTVAEQNVDEQNVAEQTVAEQTVAEQNVAEQNVDEQNVDQAALVAPSGACKSLFVQDLAPTVTESTLLEVFQKTAQIQSIHVCRDSATRLSLGYAYVNFHRAEDCDQALAEVNFQEIEGKICRISKSLRDPSIRKSGVGNLFIKNLAKDIDHAGLHDVFANFGEIMSCKVATDRVTGESKGYGFVHFAKPEEGKNALANLNGKCLNGKQVYVAKFIPRQKRIGSGSASAHFTNIYLNNLHPDLTQTRFIELVTAATSDLGEITSPKLMVTENEDGTEVSKGFGFVNFESHEVAAKALDRFKNAEKMTELAPGLTAEGKELYSNPAMSTTKRRLMVVEEKNLYVKNIAETVTEERFKELFEFGPDPKGNGEKEFGTITSACIMKDGDTGAHKGFGFVCYESKESAVKAMTIMNGFRLDDKPLYVGVAQPKELRRKQLAQRFARGQIGPHVGYPVAPYLVPQPFPPGRNPQFSSSRGGRPGFQSRGGVPVNVARAPFPPQSDPRFWTELLKTFPDGVVSQHLGDMLFKTLIKEDRLPEYHAKCVVGSVLKEHQNQTVHEKIAHIQFLLSTLPVRHSLINKVLSGQNAQQS